MIAPEMFELGPSPSAEKVLGSGMREAVNDIEAARVRHPGRAPREEGEAGGLPGRGGVDDFDWERRRVSGLTGHDRHVGALSIKLVGNLPRHIFDAACTRDEALDDDGDAQGELLAWGMGRVPSRNESGALNDGSRCRD